MEQFKVMYTQFEKLAKQYDITLLCSSEEITDDFVNRIKNSNTENVLPMLVSMDDFNKLDDMNKKIFTVFIKQLQNNHNHDEEKTDEALVNSLKSLNGIDTSKLNITESHLTEASKMITDTLGLKSSGMNNLIQDMIGDIGKSVEKGVSISDMIANLSKDFGKKLNDSVKSGTISKSEIESTTKNVFSNLQNMTQNPNQLMKMVQGAVTGTAEKTEEQKAEEKHKRREKLKKKWRNQRRVNKRK